MMIPVIDISRWQGNFDFTKAKNLNVQGVIMRATNGLTVDVNLAEYVTGAKAAGYTDNQLGFYTFCNPKRSNPEMAAIAFVGAVRNVLGHLRTILMLDVESYVNEGPYVGTKLTAPAYAAWLRQLRHHVQALAPEAKLIMYTNRAYWNPEVGATDFGDMDIIVARYPFYSDLQNSLHPVPHDANQWADWIMAETEKRPLVPNGWDTWDGWQFSAGYNKMGPVYGASSTDLDLNIIKEEAWRSWTAQTAVVSPETPPNTITALEATGGNEMLTIIGQNPETVLGKRWVWNGLVKFATTEAQANVLVARGAVGGGAGSRLDNPVWFSAAEIDAMPTVVVDNG